ncbi:DNA helicase [Tanacetum coccineum]
MAEIDTSENIVRRPLLTTRNHAYLCVDTKDCTIRPAIIRKNTQSPLVTRAEEALSSRTVNIGRKRKNASSLLALHPEDTLFTRSIRRRYTPATSNICRANTNRNSRVTNIQNLSMSMAHAKNDTPSYMNLGDCHQRYTPATTSICRVNTNRNSPSTNIQNLSKNTADARDDTPSYMDLGDCDQQCRHCGCLFWYNERLKGGNYTREAEYHLCCGGGQIYMPPTPDPPAFIQQLFKNNQFMEHIRAYNQMVAMTSFGAKINHSLYVYNTRDELRNRMHHFGGLDESILNSEIVEGLIHVLDEHNGLVRLFRTARDKYNAGDIPSFKIRLYNMGGVRGYELPTADVLGAIVFENGPRSRIDFDRQRKKSDNERLLQISVTPTEKRIWTYLERRTAVLTICRLYDVVSRGDHEGIAAGSKTMLPNTFTGGPRYMYNHYLDALAICQSLGNPQFFITFTCNVMWPEIKRYMAQFPELTPTDRVDIIPDPVQDPKGYKLVTELMMHGPCGSANLDAPCMQNGPCNKHFPKQYKEQTHFDSNGHTQYRRRDTGIYVMKGESRLDNCNVIPYNRALCLAFEAHINVEYCGWSMLIKYLFKYISKGPDRILAKISNSKTSTSAVGTNKKIDEIQKYVDGRFICPFEACWRIFDFLIHCREPAVQILNVHWICNALIFVKGIGDLFYFRMLLCHQKGCKSPDEVRTVNGQMLPTFRAACEALGLLGDDKEWDIALEESTASTTSKEIRVLFAQILIYCDVADPVKLWAKHWEAMQDDIPEKISEATEIQNYYVNNVELQGYILYDSLRSEGNIVLAVVSSGIASLLLPAGCTTHSRFKLPLELTNESFCHTKKKSQLGNLLVETDLIIWDEAPMNDKRCFETLDRTLRDLMDTPNILFGGKTIVLGGDFRQTLLVKKGAGKEELIAASIAESYLWCHFRICTLKENIRLQRFGLTSEERKRS